MAKLMNRADISGTFDEVTVDNYTELSVELSAIDITKSADKAIWVKGELTYTLTVTDIDVRKDITDPQYPGLPVTNVVVKDIIDPTIAELVANSVTIDGKPAVEATDYTYDPTSGLLQVTLGTVNVGTPRIIMFRVEMV